MRFLLFLFIGLCFYCSPMNAQYVFTGNGAWSNVNNWQNGLKPPNTLSVGFTISIVGTATTDPNLVFPEIAENRGTITVETGGSLTLSNQTQFANKGAFIVHGTYINKTTWENYQGATVNVSGVFKNQSNMPYPASFTNHATITVENGGVFRNETTDFYNLGTGNNTSDGFLIINNGGTFLNFTVAKLYGNLINNGTFINYGTLIGAPSFSGNLTNNATISPGSSPGTYTISGDYSATSTAIHTFEIAGINTGQYDVINASGNVTLGGALNVTLISAFTPTVAHSLPIITGTISGNFSSVTLPAGYSLIYNTNNVKLQFGTVLPVKFVSLDARKEGSSIQLNWKVAEEQNVSSYEIEKSLDGARFTKIGWVKAAGQNLYYFKDNSLSSKAFYRVKSVDNDGKSDYSVVVKYSNGRGIVNLSVFPVPAQSELIFQHPTAAKHNNISISTMEGKVLQRIAVSEGSQQTSIDVSSFAKGVYLLIFSNDNEKAEVIRFIK